MKSKTLVAAFLGCGLLLQVTSAVSQQEEILESDDGEIVLTQPTKAGNLILQPGSYLLQSRAPGGHSVVRFMQVERSQEFLVSRKFTGWYTDAREHNAGEVACRVEPLGATVQATTVMIASDDGMPWITRVMVKGKAEVCVF